MAGNIDMYTAKPLYKIGKIELPTVMYKTEQLVGESGEPQMQGDLSPELMNLKIRQQTMLDKLDKLINQFSTPSSEKVTCTLEKSSAALEMLKDGSIDIVIHAAPESPPRSLVYILTQLNKCFRTLHRVHLHSGVTKGHDLFPVSTEYQGRSDYEVIVTLIWSSTGILPRVCVNAATSSSVYGESNIVRLFGRLLGSFDSGRSVEEDTITDICCDLCDCISSCSMGKKEKMAACKNLSKILPKIANELTKALVSSTLRNFGDLPPGDLKKWLDSN